MMHYLILYKMELIALLNNLEVNIPEEGRVVGFGQEIVKDKLLNTLLELPQFDFDEDVIVIKTRLSDEHAINKIHLEEVCELIPLTRNAFFAYQRKFSNGLIWTSPEGYGLEETYQEYRIKKIYLDTKRAVDWMSRLFLDVKTDLIDQEQLEGIIKAKTDKIIYGKRDVDIQKGEYSDFFQTLFIYEDGSHIQRNNPIGFILHVFGARVYHNGGGDKFRIKNDLRRIKGIDLILVDWSKNFYLSFESAFTYIEELSNSTESVFKLVNGLQDLSTATYFLYFRFLVEVEKYTFRDIFTAFEELKVKMTDDIKIALALTAAYFPLSRMAEDVMSRSKKVSVYMPDDTSEGGTPIHEKIERISFFITDRFERDVLNSRRKYPELIRELERDGYKLSYMPVKRGDVVKDIYNPFDDKKEKWVKPGKGRGDGKLKLDFREEEGAGYYGYDEEFKKAFVSDYSKMDLKEFIPKYKYHLENYYRYVKKIGVRKSTKIGLPALKRTAEDIYKKILKQF